MQLQEIASQSCWNCNYRFQANQIRCPRCGIPVPDLKGASTVPDMGRSKPVRHQRRRPQPAEPALGEVIPPRPPRPSLLARLRTSAGQGVLQTVDAAKRVGSITATATTHAAGQAAKLVAGTAGWVSKGTKQLVARPSAHPLQIPVGIDALRRESARTLADVAELLLRETREENAILRERLDRLEATLAERAKSASGDRTRAPRQRESRPGATRRNKASAPKAKAPANRASQQIGQPRDAVPGQPPPSARRPVAVAQNDDVAAGPTPNSADVVRIETRRDRARRRTRAQRTAEVAG